MCAARGLRELNFSGVRRSEPSQPPRTRRRWTLRISYRRREHSASPVKYCTDILVHFPYFFSKTARFRPHAPRGHALCHTLQRNSAASGLRRADLEIKVCSIIAHLTYCPAGPTTDTLRQIQLLRRGLHHHRLGGRVHQHAHEHHVPCVNLLQWTKLLLPAY